MVKIIMSRAIKREPNSPICGVVYYWYQIMIKLSRKVIVFWLLRVIVCSFKMQENTSLRLQNFKIFRGSMQLDPPRGARPSGPCQIFARVSNSVALLFKTLMNPLERYQTESSLTTKLHNFTQFLLSHKFMRELIS